MTEQEALHIVRNPWGHSAHEQHEAAIRLAEGVELLSAHLDGWKKDYDALAKKLDAAEKLAHAWQVRYETLKAAAEIQNSDVDLSLYGKGEPKSLEELKASHDRLVGSKPWKPDADCSCPPDWTRQCKSRACPRHRTKNTRD